MQTYDPSIVTHVVTHGDMKAATRAQLGIKKLADIPEHIKTVTWDWVVCTKTKGEPAIEMWYEPFAERLERAPALKRKRSH